MMKRKVTMSIMWLVIAWGFAAVSFAEDTITLRFAHQNPDSAISSTQAVVPWFEQVEKATKGKVKTQIFWSQTLAKGKDNWEATKNGITDIAWCFHGYWPNMTPLADVISLPAMPFTTAEQGSEALWKLYEKHPEIQKEFADNKVLLLFTSPPYTLITRDKQVKTLEDLKGLKIRMTGGPPTDMMTALGAVPLLQPMPEMFLNLQKGVVDGMGAPWEAIHGFRFYEVVKHYTEVPFPAVYFSISMNKAKWASLPKDVQDAILSVSGLEGSKFWGRMFFDSAKQASIDKAKEGKIDIMPTELSAAERQRWLEIGGKPIWEQWVAKMEKDGHPEARKILDSTLEILGSKK
jgi:TRAP-type transport system periplasmic protein